MDLRSIQDLLYTEVLNLSGPARKKLEPDMLVIWIRDLVPYPLKKLRTTADNVLRAADFTKETIH